MDYKEYISKILGDDGVLAKQLPGYKARPGQLKMAGDVADAIQNGHDLVVEAGTGTGKTFAYLLPSIISKKKVLVSTQTRNLQDQISEKDLPRLISMLGDDMQIKTAALKGRSGEEGLGLPGDHQLRRRRCGEEQKGGQRGDKRGGVP